MKISRNGTGGKTMKSRSVIAILALITIPVTAAALTFVFRENTPKTVYNFPGADESTQCKSEAECLALALLDIVAKNPAEALALYEDQASSNHQLAVGCHAAYHIMGREASKHYDDPWDAIAAGNDNCNFGFAHGVVEGLVQTYVSNKTQIYKLQDACRPREDFEGKSMSILSSCLHGAGHALLRTYKDPVEALDDCVELFTEQGSGDVSDCADGVFMEYANSPWAYSSNDRDPKTLCSDVPEHFSRVCWSNIGAVWLSGGGDTLVALSNCTASKSFETECVTNVAILSIFHVLAQSSGDYSKAYDVCDKLQSDESIQACYKGVTVGFWTAAAQGAYSLELARGLLDNRVPSKFKQQVTDFLDQSLQGLPDSQRPEQ